MVKRHGKKCLAARLRCISGLRVRLQPLLDIQTEADSPSQSALDNFLLACVLIFREDSSNVSIFPHEALWSPYCGRDGLPPQQCCPAAEERREVSQPKGNRTNGVVKMKVSFSIYILKGLTLFSQVCLSLVKDMVFFQIFTVKFCSKTCPCQLHEPFLTQNTTLLQLSGAVYS